MLLSRPSQEHLNGNEPIMHVFSQFVAKLGQDHLRAAVFTRFSLRGFVWRLRTRVHSVLQDCE